MTKIPTFKGVALRGVGFRPEAAQAAAAALKSGSPLLYEREPSNPYDGAAIRILTVDGTFIGFVERIQSASLAAYIDEGEMFSVWIDGKVRRDEGVFKSMTFDPIRKAEQEADECAALTNMLKRKKTKVLQPEEVA